MSLQLKQKQSQILYTKEIELLDERYVVYLKRVPVQIVPGGKPIKTAIRAFVKKV